MGILDDAIREPLELKRAHGADEEEVRRKETEAFGPVRHDAAPAEAPVGDEHTQLLATSDDISVAEAAHAEADALQPAPEDPYAVHPGDHAVPDPAAEQDVHADRAEHAAPPVEEHFDTQHAAEAGAGMLEPHEVDPGPPTGGPPTRHPTDEHPALVDHDRFHGEDHAPEPVFGHAPEAPVAPAYDTPTEAYETPTAPPDAPLEPPPRTPPRPPPPGGAPRRSSIPRSTSRHRGSHRSRRTPEQQRTRWRRPRSSCRTHRSTTGSGSSRSPRATSTSASSSRRATGGQAPCCALRRPGTGARGRRAGGLGKKKGDDAASAEHHPKVTEPSMPSHY